MAVNIHITIIELNALHTKRQNLFQELDAVIHLLMEAKHWGLRKSRNATSLNSRFKSLDTLKVKIISVTFRRVKEMTRKVSAEVDLVHQQTQNQRYGSSHIGATAKDISNVVTDAASGVVDIFHGIDKAVADTWNNFWKDGKADGI